MDEAAKSLIEDHKSKTRLVVARLGDSKKRVRVKAALELAKLGPEYQDEVLSFVRQENSSWQESRRKWAIAGMVASTCIIELLVLGPGGSTESKLIRFALALPLAFVAFMILDGLMAHCVKLNRLIPAMCEIEDVRTIEPLLGALYMCKIAEQDHVEEALQRLIDKCHENAWDALGSNSRSDLNRFVRNEKSGVRFRNTSTKMSVLRLFAACGGTPELKSSRQLASKAKQPDVRQAAADCAEAIAARLEGSSNHAVLLRPSSSSVEENSLVRPSIKAGSVNASNLLRPEPEIIESVSLKANGSVDG